MLGYIVIITRNGSLGGRYPISSKECVFGQSPTCDVRVYVANVARKHCLIAALPNERAYIRNLSPSNSTLLNGIQIGATQCELKHADVITVGDRHFRWEYPMQSQQRTPAKQTKGYMNNTPTCMVQVPMSVLKKKRHSSGVLQENKIISFTSQEGAEPDTKRRKTIHSITDLGMENKAIKPVNKHLKAVTRLASSPKSFKTFNLLLKSPKRMSLRPISKTPKPPKKVITSNISRSKSLSPHKPNSKNSPPSVLKYKPVLKVSKLSTPPLKSAKKKLSSPAVHIKNNSSATKITPTRSLPSIEKLKTMKEKTSGRTPTNKNKSQSATKSKSPSPAKSPTFKVSKLSLKGSTPRKTPIGRPPKTPQSSIANKTVSTIKSTSSKLRNRSSLQKDRTPRNTPKSRPITSKISPSRKSKSPVKAQSLKTSPKSVIEMTPNTKPRRGRPPKSPQVSTTRKSISSAESSPDIFFNASLFKDNTSERVSNDSSEFTQITPTMKSVSPAASKSPKASQTGSTARGEASDRKPRGRPPKTSPVSSLSRNSLSPAKTSDNALSVSPMKDRTPGKTRGRSPNISQNSPTRSVSPVKSLNNSQSASLLKENTPRKTPTARISPKTTRISSVPRITIQPEEVSEGSSPVMGQTAKAKPSKTFQASPTNKSVSSAKSPRTSWSVPLIEENSPIRTPRGRPSVKLNTLPSQSASPERSRSVASHKFSPEHGKVSSRSPKDSSKTPEAPLKKKSPAKSSLKTCGSDSPVNSSGKRSRGRPSQASKISLSRNSIQQKDDLSPYKLSFSRTSLMEDNTNLSVQQSSDSLVDNESKIQTSTNLVKSARRSALRSGLSNSKNEKVTPKSNLLLKSSTKKADITKLQIDSKRKYDTDAEAKAERAAKRLKMETPKSLTKNKKAAILVCHSPKSQKRPLFSEILKSHLSTIKKKQAASTVLSNVSRKPAKPMYQLPLSLEVPKSFKFNSTGHANSPDTIIIKKKVKESPLPKTRKGRKSNTQLQTTTIEDQNLEGVLELPKTPKSLISSLKNASSMKKSQNVRVRFSLQNYVQSPSGKRSLVMQSGENTHFGSPIVTTKKYFGTPRPSTRRISDTSLMHTSIMEESPLAQEINISDASNPCDKSYNFSVYSPSSPTLQFSRISGFSSDFARRSLDLTDSPESPASGSSSGSRKRKKSITTTSDMLIHQSPYSQKRISFSSVRSLKSNISSEFQPSPGSGAILSQSDLFVSNSVISEGSQGTPFSKKSGNKLLKNTEDNGNISATSVLNVSQIPLPQSPVVSQTRQSSPVSLSILNSPPTSTSMRSTRSNKSSVSDTTSLVKSPQIIKSKVQLESSTGNKISSLYNSKISQISDNSNQLLNLSNSSCSNNSSLSELPKRISSTPKLQHDLHLNSPISSPISILNKRSLRSLGFTSPPTCSIESSMSTSATFKTPLPTPEKKPRKSSTRMNASNAELQTPESQVPVAAVRPSTRKKHGNDSYSSASGSVSLPAFSVSHDISERSMDRSLAQKMLDSRASSRNGLFRTSRSSTPSLSDQSNVSLDSLSSSRRKRKSSASSSIHSVDATTFDFSSATTPKIPREIFVSPLDKVSDDLTNVSGVKKILNPKGISPVSSYVDVSGIKMLLKTPKIQNDLTDVTGIKRIMSPRGNSPISSYVDVKGVKRLLRTPKSAPPLANYASIEGIKGLFKNSPVADYTNVAGVKNLYSTSVEPNYINVKGVRRIFKETKVPNSPDIAGVEVLFESPKKIMDEYNQSPSNKPVGKVPPMSRQDSSMKTSRDTTNIIIDQDVEDNTETASRNVEHDTQTGLRRRIVAHQSSNKKDTLSTSVISSRKSRRLDADSQIVPKAAIENGDSVDIDSSQASQNNTKHLKTQRGRALNKKTQALQGVKGKSELGLGSILTAKDNAVEHFNISATVTLALENQNQSGKGKTKKNNIKSPKIEPIANQEISLTKPVRRTRNKPHQENVDSSQVPVSSKEVIINNNAEESEPIGRKTRGRPKKPTQGREVEESNKKSKRVKVQDTTPDKSPDSVKTKKEVRNKTEVKESSNSETQDKQFVKGLRSESTDMSSSSSVYEEKSAAKFNKSKREAEAPKRSTRSRRGQDNEEKATSVNLSVHEEIVDNTENSSKEPGIRRKRGTPEAQEASSKSPKVKSKSKVEQSITDDHMISDPKELPKKSLRRTKTDRLPNNTTKLPSPEKYNKSNKGEPLVLEDSSSEPSTSYAASSRLRIQKETRRRVQFDIVQSPPEETVSTRRGRTRTNASSKSDVKTASPSPSPTKKVPAKTVATKTRATPKLKAAAKAASPVLKKDTPEKKELPKRKNTRSKASPKAETIAKSLSPISKGNESKKKVPAKKVTAKTKAAPEVATKLVSPIPKDTESKKKVPVKKVTLKTKDTTKKVAAKTASPSTSPTKKVPAKTVATKTRATPKLKAAAKRKSSTPTKTPPAKRITRSRK